MNIEMRVLLKDAGLIISFKVLVGLFAIEEKYFPLGE